MVNLFGEFVQDLEWKKERQLPDWAQAIFSKHMVAASNVRIEEMQQVVTMALDNLDTYLAELPTYTTSSVDSALIREKQNRYCYYQKQNPHTPKVMESLGLDPVDVRTFIDECLFPED